MMAPTPISSLVHSSTLVTAGLFILLIFNPVLILTNSVILLSFVLITNLAASSLCVVSQDFKALVAYSTLSQLSLVFIFMFVAPSLAFLHICLHALFKRGLFISVGGVLHLSSGAQDMRVLRSSESSGLASSLFFLSAIGLSGTPFFASFFTKESVLFQVE